MECCGCGVEFGDQEGPTHAYMLSSPGCWSAYGQVLARAYEHPSSFELHWLAVDTYAAHHPGKDVPPARNSVGVHLSRLCLWIDFKWTRGEIDAAMGQLSGKGRIYPWLTPPATKAAFSVADLLAARTAGEYRETVQQWARAVWGNWREHHATVRAWNAHLQQQVTSKP